MKVTLRVSSMKVLNNILFQVLDEQLSIAGEDGELLKEGDDKKS